MDVLMTLHNAAAADDVVNIRRLVEGADVNAAGDGGWRPLHEAAYHGHVGAVDMLVEVGAEVDASAADGWRPLTHGGMAGTCGSGDRLHWWSWGRTLAL
jgi:ankyrin repeat protein